MLCLLVVFFCSPILFSPQFSLLTGFDTAAMDFPWYNYIAYSLKHGHIPLWDPYVQGGRSFVGESATGGFSPLRWASVLLLSSDGQFSPRSMHIVYVFLHLLAAALMFALARTLGLSLFAALFAGFCFSVAGFTGRAGWFDMLESAVWLPLIFLFQVKALQENNARKRFSYALYAAVAMGMTVLAGRVHIAIMDVLLVIAAAAFYAVSTAKDRGDSFGSKNKWLSAGLVVTVIGVASFAAAAVQLLPSMEYAREANRWIGAPGAVAATEKIPYAYLSHGYSPRALFALLFPFIDVGPGELTPYFGILPFFLALIGVWKNWGNRWVRFLAGAAMVSFFYSLGSYSYLHRLAYFFVPYLWIAREASRFIYLTHFAGAILAGFGIDTLFLRAGRHDSTMGLMNVLRWCAIGSTAVVGVLILLRSPEASDWIVLSFLFLAGGYLLLSAIARGYHTAGASFLLMAITFCDVGAFSWSFYNVIDVRAQGVDHLKRLMSTRPAVSFIKAQPGLFRVHVDTTQEPNIGDVYQVQATASGMSATALKSYDRLIDQCGRLDLLNVRYLLRESKAPGQAVYESNGWKVVEVRPGYPRAWLVHSAVIQPSEQKIFQQACNRDFDPLQTAILDSPLETQLDGNGASLPGTATVRAYEPERMEVETRSEGRALLVLSEMYYPGWIAEVNGVPAKIHKVDGALRGVVVPAGMSRVVLRYAPRSVALGATLTLLTFIGTLLLVSVNWAKNRRNRHKELIHAGK
jgi:hypothetical protein